MIIALTPMRNEEWIIELFIKTTINLVDKIIILDQVSNDRSPTIAQSYDKVIYIRNDNGQYDERSRQIRLLQECRDRFGVGNVVLALDADELVVCPDGFSAARAELSSFSPGDAIYVEKPAPLSGLNELVRYADRSLIGFVDDGREHSPKVIHSQRVPLGSQAFKREPSLYALHACFLRPKMFDAKWRWYSVIENLSRSSRWWQRMMRYERDYIERHVKDYERTGIPNEWFDVNAALFEQLRLINEGDPGWYDREVLEILLRNGCARFWLEDIWSVDWRKKSLDSVDLESSTSSRAQKPIWSRSPYEPARLALLGSVKHLAAAKSSMRNLFRPRQ